MSRLLAFLLFLACGYIAAQPVSNHSTPLLLVSVLDRHGRPVRDLTKDNFQVKVNGRPATHLEAIYSLAPRRIVVVLDMSESMAGTASHNKWRIASEALEDLLAETPPDVSISLLTFSDHVLDIFDFTQSRKSMAGWLKEGSGKGGDPRVRGRTALFDAMFTATKLLGPIRPGDAIYAITDAGDNCSHISTTKIRRLLLQSEIRLFVFLFAERQPAALRSSGIEPVEEIARATGGFVFGMSSRSWGVDWLSSGQFLYDYDERTRETIKLYTQALNLQVNGFYRARDFKGRRS